MGGGYPKVHPTQKPISVLMRLIEIFTDEGDVVIDPVAGSGSTLRASYEMGRDSYGFEIEKQFYKDAKEKMLSNLPVNIMQYNVDAKREERKQHYIQQSMFGD